MSLKCEGCHSRPCAAVSSRLLGAVPVPCDTSPFTAVYAKATGCLLTDHHAIQPENIQAATFQKRLPPRHRQSGLPSGRAVMHDVHDLACHANKAAQCTLRPLPASLQVSSAIDSELRQYSVGMCNVFIQHSSASLTINEVCQAIRQETATGLPASCTPCGVGTGQGVMSRQSAAMPQEPLSC